MNDLGTISLNTCNSRAQTDLSAMLSDAGHQRFSETAKPAFEVCQLLSTLVITSATPQNQFLPHPDRIDSFGEHGNLELISGSQTTLYTVLPHNGSSHSRILKCSIVFQSLIRLT